MTWWEASGQHGNLNLLESFRSDIQDGHPGIHLEILQTTSLEPGCLLPGFGSIPHMVEPYVGLSRNQVGGIGAVVEHSGSVECLNRDRRVASLSLTATGVTEFCLERCKTLYPLISTGSS